MPHISGTELINQSRRLTDFGNPVKMVNMSITFPKKIPKILAHFILTKMKCSSIDSTEDNSCGLEVNLPISTIGVQVKVICKTCLTSRLLSPTCKVQGFCLLPIFPPAVL